MDKHTYIISVQKNVQGLICCGYITGCLRSHNIKYKESNKRNCVNFYFSINDADTIKQLVIFDISTQLKQLLGSIKDKLGGLL